MENTSSMSDTPRLFLRRTHGEIAPSPGPGWHYLPHKHTWGVTHGPDGHAQGERVMMRRSQWPVVQGNEMHLSITVYYNGRVEGLVCRWRRRCGETLSEISYTSVHGKKMSIWEVLLQKKQTHTFSITSSSIEPCSPICDLGTLHYSVILRQYVETAVFKWWFSTGQPFHDFGLKADIYMITKNTFEDTTGSRTNGLIVRVRFFS